MLRNGILGLVAVTLVASSVLAQPEDAATDATPQPDAVPDKPAPPARSAASQGSADSGAADEYRASEQISDDLSVSFPVDI
ncbi:hypothetical protein EYC98_17435 [Halieaceae bacterium IMCC14734]|uniref:Uncharacterized protein n=1 Tax=Candidatus Litorirhabdus singularis TaxID=2518993 RepID=A0ABT3TK13_9GAMM|nr:hypothetical protein [Candidatus Litorirhabdus singularis]MCX2982647.1 hypothetical protein [Candidatus Litorirhabdus singularis]